MQINKLLQTVVTQKASDLILTVGCKPKLRLNGRLADLQTKVLDPDDTVALMKSITSERGQQELQEVGSHDFGFSFGEQARFRVAVFKQRGYVGIVLRLIPSKLLSFEEIGLSEDVKRVLWRPRGLILITGPTGSGKTTTLATMIDFINSTRDTHIITIEDPIEYFHNHKRSVVTQRELGVDVPTFAEGLRRALRQNPDVILVGEMRDLETMETAISAAETGHLRLRHPAHQLGGDQHQPDRGRLPPQQQEQVRIQLASNLLMIICQALIPDVTGRGRVAAFEILVRTDAISNLIRQQKIYQIQSEIQTGSKHGMILLDDSLAQLFHAGRITQEEAMNRCRNHRRDGAEAANDAEDDARRRRRRGRSNGRQVAPAGRPDSVRSPAAAKRRRQMRYSARKRLQRGERLMADEPKQTQSDAAARARGPLAELRPPPRRSTSPKSPKPRDRRPQVHRPDPQGDAPRHRGADPGGARHPEAERRRARRHPGEPQLRHRAGSAHRPRHRRPGWKSWTWTPWNITDDVIAAHHALDRLGLSRRSRSSSRTTS